LRSPGRRAPAASADLALRLLLRHSDWWQQLPADDHMLLHELGGSHGEAVSWLEQQLMEHGPLTWSALAQAMADEPWHAQARAWVDAADPGEEQDFNDLQRVMHRLWIARLGDEAKQLAAAGDQGDEQLARLRALHEQIGRLKALLTAP
jgi:DNA primase